MQPENPPQTTQSQPPKEVSSHGRWTKEEHQRFVDALKKFGKNWKQVEDYVATRSGAQIRSHAQKFFNRLEREQMSKVDTSKDGNGNKKARAQRKYSDWSESTNCSLYDFDDITEEEKAALHRDLKKTLGDGSQTQSGNTSPKRDEIQTRPQRPPRKMSEDISLAPKHSLNQEKQEVFEKPHPSSRPRKMSADINLNDTALIQLKNLPQVSQGQQQNALAGQQQPKFINIQPLPPRKMSEDLNANLTASLSNQIRNFQNNNANPANQTGGFRPPRKMSEDLHITGSTSNSLFDMVMKRVNLNSYNPPKLYDLVETHSQKSSQSKDAIPQQPKPEEQKQPSSNNTSNYQSPEKAHLQPPSFRPNPRKMSEDNILLKQIMASDRKADISEFENTNFKKVKVNDDEGQGEGKGETEGQQK